MNTDTDTAQNALNLTPDFTVDARNQPCPMPILMLKRLLKTIEKTQSSSENSNSKNTLLIFNFLFVLNIFLFRDYNFTFSNFLNVFLIKSPNLANFNSF